MEADRKSVTIALISKDRFKSPGEFVSHQIPGLRMDFSYLLGVPDFNGSL